MNRAKIIDAAAQAIREADGSHTMGAAALAEVVVDTLLPQVTTSEELQKLPNGTVLIGPAGGTWQINSGPDNLRKFARSMSDGHRWLFVNGVSRQVQPLTVVWSPES